jgi:hypothetical protein
VVFAVAFLGALFAILVSLLVVYTYVTLRLVPRLKRSFRAFVEEMGPRAMFEQAGIDPAAAMQQLDIPLPSDPRRASLPGRLPLDRRFVPDDEVRVVYTCEDHGRCVGCPKVLAQFEAIVRNQGADSFDEIERRCYDQLRDQLSSDALIDGESEADRQKRIAARVVEALVREGFSPNAAREAVWSCGKAPRGTFASWFIVAQARCRELRAQDEEKVA